MYLLQRDRGRIYIKIYIQKMVKRLRNIGKISLTKVKLFSCSDVSESVESIIFSCIKQNYKYYKEY